MGLKVEFLAPVKFGFQEATPGYEAQQVGDDLVFERKEFAVGETFEFPVEERDAVQALIDDGLAIKASDGNAKAKVVKETPDAADADAEPDPKAKPVK